MVIGSQAILGACPDAPEELLRSMEADVYPLDAPEKSDLIDGCIGELSPFHETFGYYAHGVDPGTATLPKAWRTRLVPVGNENTGGTVGWCLAPVDLAVSKLAAAREKDVKFVGSMIRSGILTESAVAGVLVELEPKDAAWVKKMLATCV